MQLFHGVVLNHTEFWLSKFEAAVRLSTTYNELRSLIEILHFDGSLIVFSFPDLTKLILSHAEQLDGTEGYKQMRALLWSISGPGGRSYTIGELDQDSDCVEAEAIKAASAAEEVCRAQGGHVSQLDPKPLISTLMPRGTVPINRAPLGCRNDQSVGG